jgi:hypothetical protein
MNGIQVEKVLSLIDANLELTKAEVLRYMAQNQEKVVRQLEETGEARIPTTAGVVIIPRSALETFAA